MVVTDGEERERLISITSTMSMALPINSRPLGPVRVMLIEIDPSDLARQRTTVAKFWLSMLEAPTMR